MGVNSLAEGKYRKYPRHRAVFQLGSKVHGSCHYATAFMEEPGVGGVCKRRWEISTISYASLYTIASSKFLKVFPRVL